MSRAPGALLLAGLLAGCTAAARADAPPVRAGGLALVPVASRLEAPVHLTAPAGDTRLFIVEQRGRIRIVKDGRLLEAPFLDLTDRVRYGGERGLLSIAFHPDYARNGFLFVNYTDRAGDTRIERYSAGAGPARADATSARLVLTVKQPFANHNGGHILFGPDGLLYVGMGDGGSAGDPFGNGQNLGTLLGKLLRLDVDHGAPYAIPGDNPFVGREGARGEIWAYGLRNPWRLAIDRETKLLYIADVGQNRWEEVDVAPLATRGLDYGWNVREGRHGFGFPRPAPRGAIEPALEYAHDDGCSITGGLVYRGRAMPELAGTYFFADYCRGWLRSFRWASGRATEYREWDVPALPDISSFGEDAGGELYVLSLGGRVWRLARASRVSPARAR